MNRGLPAVPTSDIKRKAESYRLSAEQGSAQSQYNLGLCYIHGKGSEDDNKEGVKWLQKSANQGYAPAQRLLGCQYVTGTGTPADPKLAAEWCLKAAEQGDMHGQYLMAVFHLNGDGVPKDMQEAVKWCLLAAEQGHKAAQAILGFHFAKGVGVPKDEAQALRWYRAAAEQGHANAQYQLGLCYLYGIGVEDSEFEAKGWFEEAAYQEHKEAQVRLDAHNLRWSNFDDVDSAIAVRRIRDAAEGGSSEAQIALGACLENGNGMKEDWDEAIRWYTKSAAQNHAQAKLRLKSLRQTRAKRDSVIEWIDFGEWLDPSTFWGQLINLALHIVFLIIAIFLMSCAVAFVVVCLERLGN